MHDEVYLVDSPPGFRRMADLLLSRRSAIIISLLLHMQASAPCSIPASLGDVSLLSNDDLFQADVPRDVSDVISDSPASHGVLQYAIDTPPRARPGRHNHTKKRKNTLRQDRAASVP